MLTRFTMLGGLVAVAVIAAAGFGGWWFFIRDDAPPPVNLQDAVASTQDTPTATATTSTEATSTSADTASTPTASATPAATAEAGRAPGELNGAWVLSDQGESFAGYRIQEELASIGGNTAVGRTSALEASLEFDGSAITAVEVVVDMTQLQSDDGRRDRQLRTRAIETNSFPTATFVLTEPIVLDGVPEVGVPVSATAVGDFTLHGVTRSVSIPIEGQFVSEDLVVVIGSLDIALADYDIDPPTGLSVLSVADEGVMEFQLVFE